MSKKVEVFEYTSKSGQTWDAYSLRELLETAGVAIPAETFPMAIRLGNGADDFAICFWKKRTSESKPSNFKRKDENAAPIMAQPLAQISPDKLLATMLSRLSQEQIQALAGQPAMAPSQAPAKRKMRGAA